MNQNPSGRERGPRSVQEFFIPKTPEEFLSWVDLKTLNSIFFEMQRKSMVREIKELKEDRIKFAKNLDSESIELGAKVAGVYIGDDILLNEEYFFQPGKENIRALDALSVLIHEALHYISHSEKKPSEDQSETEITHLERVGFMERQFETNDKIYSLGRGLNEGMTESLALKVLDEYLRRTGNMSLLADLSVNEQVHIGMDYRKEREGLALVVKVLSRRLELPEEEVQQAFVREYFTHQHTMTEVYEMVHDVLIDIQSDTAKEAKALLSRIIAGQVYKRDEKHEGYQYLEPNVQQRISDIFSIAAEQVNWDKIDSLARALKLR